MHSGWAFSNVGRRQKPSPTEDWTAEGKLQPFRGICCGLRVSYKTAEYVQNRRLVCSQPTLSCTVDCQLSNKTRISSLSLLSMKRLPLTFVLIAFALSGCSQKVLTLKEIRNPTPSMLDRAIITQGFFSSSDEQDLLTGERGRFVDLVDLAMFPGLPKEQRSAKRAETGRRLDGKLVAVRGRLKVGPFGLSGRSTVYIEVETISEVSPAAE